MKYIMGFILCLILFTGIAVSNAYSCTAELNITGCGPGLQVDFSGVGSSVGGTSHDFNSGVLPAGWSAGGGFTVDPPACAKSFPGWDGSAFYWASTAGAATPYIATNDVDVSAGGNITFTMAYSVQGNAAPCEGPDSANEGVTLEYSNNGGTSWTTIQYWDPLGGAAGATAFTGTWNTVTIAIPAGAQTASTRFRWIQYNSSGELYDNWGIENASIGTAWSVTNYEWDFEDDGAYDVSGAAAATTSHTYGVAGTYDVRLRITTDQPCTNEVVKTVKIPNSTPTDISLSNASIVVGTPSNSTVGTFSTTDPNGDVTFTYSLVAGAGDVDNGSFWIDGDQLKTLFAAVVPATYNIRVQTDDQYCNGTYAEAVTITTVADVSEFNLRQGVTNIADGGTHDFGSQISGSDTDVVFTIENAGSANLILTAPITLAGPDAAEFSVEVQPTSPVAAAGTTTFTVRFSPTTAGAKSSSITISNNDGDENPYDLTVIGTGTAQAAIPTLSEWGMIFFSILLGGTAIYTMRRKQEGEDGLV